MSLCTFKACFVKFGLLEVYIQYFYCQQQPGELKEIEEAGALYRDLTAFQAPSPSTATRRIPTASPRPRWRCLTITGEVSPRPGSCIRSILRLCFLPLPPAPRQTLTCTPHVSLVIVAITETPQDKLTLV